MPPNYRREAGNLFSQNCEIFEAPHERFAVEVPASAYPASKLYLTIPPR